MRRLFVLVKTTLTCCLLAVLSLGSAQIFHDVEPTPAPAFDDAEYTAAVQVMAEAGLEATECPVQFGPDERYGIAYMCAAIPGERGMTEGEAVAFGKLVYNYAVDNWLEATDAEKVYSELYTQEIYVSPGRTMRFSYGKYLWDVVVAVFDTP